ncbi:ACT domain-containing protein [Curvibacter sp. CHRR-16]|uniref:ACT domain-containing protein n=1 Tax=Curvibacter sp. CHRR-16 TaxID=2835872 RepID=UPI0032E9C4BD
MAAPISDLCILLASMEPVLNEGTYAYCCVAHVADISHLPVIATVREAEGLTVVTTEDAAISAGLQVMFRCAWITLNVHSDLQAVGLTAAFAKALGDEGISCNVVAGAYHDHIFVPYEKAAHALSALRKLQQAQGLSVNQDQDSQQLGSLLLAGAHSAPTKPVDAAYFDTLRKRIAKD